METGRRQPRNWCLWSGSSVPSRRRRGKLRCGFRLRMTISCAPRNVSGRQRGREQAIWPAATEAAEPIFDELERAIAAVQSAEARLLSLAFGLREAAVRTGDNGNAAYAGAAAIEQRIIATRRHRAPA
jgi:hypothetical protein